MRKNVFGRRLRRDANERKALFKGLLSSLVLHGKMQTTEAKAKAIKGRADKIITRVKKQKEQAFLLLQKYLTPQAIQKVIADVAPRYTTRQGGYTRIVRVGPRISDNATMVMMEWVEADVVDMPEKKKASMKKEPKEPKKKREKK